MTSRDAPPLGALPPRSAWARLLRRRSCLVVGPDLEIAAKRIDIDATAAQEAPVNRERLGSAAMEDVDEHLLDAALVKCGVPTIGDEVAQQRDPVDPRTSIADHQVAIVGLAGDRAARTEERRAQ